jgi:WD40 repeat protein
MNTIFLRIAFLFLLTAAVASGEEKKPEKITFDDHVRPIFQEKCASCHNPDKKSGDLDVTSYIGLMAGGGSGSSFEPGDASASYLYNLVTHAEEPAMPPESPKIPDPMIEMLRKWIDGGLLENTGSTAKASKKKKFDLGLSAPSTDRPAVVPMPGRLSLQPVIYTPSRTATDALATSPWAPLAAVSSQKQVLLYNTQTLELLGVLPFPEGTPRVLKFSRNGALLLAGGGVAGAKGRVIVWDVKSGKRIIEVGEELDEVLAADISSDQTLIAMGGPGRVIRIYTTETGQLLHEIRKHTDWVTTLEFSPDSVLLATGDRNGGLHVWEGWTGREYLTLKGHTAAISSVSWRSDSNILASSSEDSTIQMWEMENGSQVKNWGAHGGGALGVEFTRDGRLFSCGRDNVSKIWDQNGAQQLAFEAFGDVALRVTFCDESNRAIAGDWNGEIRVWNAADGVRVGQLVANVPPLENRLAEASQMLTTKQTEFQAISEKHLADKSAFEKISAEFAVVQKASVEAKQKSDEANAAMTAAQALAAEMVAQHEAAKKMADEATTSAPMLKDAAEKALAASTQLPADANLATAAQAIKTSAEAKAKEMEVAVADAAKKLIAMQEAQKAAADAQKLAADMAAVMTAAQQKEQAMMPLVKPAEEAFTASKATFDQTQAAIQTATQLVSRWTGEIEFHGKYSQLQTQRAEMLAQLATHEAQQGELQAAADAAKAVLDQARNAMTAAQNELVQNEAAYKASLTTIETAKQMQTAATAAKITANGVIDQLNLVIAKLGEVAAKAGESVEMAKEDPIVLAAAAAIKTAQDEKSKQLDAAKADLEVKAKAEADAIANVAASEKASADLLAAQEPLKKKIVDTTAAIPPLEKISVEASQAAEAYVPNITTAQANVASVDQALAQLQGI